PADSGIGWTDADEWRETLACADVLGVALDSASERELEVLMRTLREPGPFLTFTNGDAGVNNFLVSGADGRIIDFEFARFQHALGPRVVRRRCVPVLRYFTERFVQAGLGPARARRRALTLYLSYVVGLFDMIRLGLADVSDAELRAHAHEVLSSLVGSAT